jgi:hypothetical protein
VIAVFDELPWKRKFVDECSMLASAILNPAPIVVEPEAAMFVRNQRVVHANMIARAPADVDTGGANRELLSLQRTGNRPKPGIHGGTY